MQTILRLMIARSAEQRSRIWITHRKLLSCMASGFLVGASMAGLVQAQPVAAAADMVRQLAIAQVAVTAISTTNLPEPEVYRGSFMYRTSTDMLHALGVAVSPQDRVAAFPEPRLGIGSTITIYRAPEVTIDDAGTTFRVQSWERTPAKILAEAAVQLGALDKVTPAVDAEVAMGGTSITITRVAETELTLTESIPYTTKTTDDPTLDRGVTVVEEGGATGQLSKVFTVRRENGKEISRNEIRRTVTKEPVQRVIRRGTKVTVLDQGIASWTCDPTKKLLGEDAWCKGAFARYTAMTTAHKTLPMGSKIRVVNTQNGKSVVVTVVDRGPYTAGRVVDLSYDAFAALTSGDPTGKGVIPSVRIERE
jgi:hypothetical protein